MSVEKDGSLQSGVYSRPIRSCAGCSPGPEHMASYAFLETAASHLFRDRRWRLILILYGRTKSR